MKFLLALLLCLPLIGNSDVIIFSENEGLEHFRSIVINFGKILNSEKDSEKLQEAVTQMIESTISLIATAKEKGLSITKEECEKIFNELDMAVSKVITRAISGSLNDEESDSSSSASCDENGCTITRSKCCCTTTTNGTTTTTTCCGKCKKCNKCNKCKTCCKSSSSCCSRSNQSMESSAESDVCTCPTTKDCGSECTCGCSIENK